MRTQKVLLFCLFSVPLFHIFRLKKCYLGSCGCYTFQKAPPLISSPLECENWLDFYLLKQKRFNQKPFFFSELLLYSWESTLNISVNTIALFHFLKSSGKYEFSDTHVLCGGGQTAGKFHLVIIHSFLCLRHLSRGETSLMMQQYNWPTSPLSALED